MFHSIIYVPPSERQKGIVTDLFFGKIYDFLKNWFQETLRLNRGDECFCIKIKKTERKGNELFKTKREDLREEKKCYDINYCAFQ